MKKNLARIIALILVIAMLAGCGFYLVYMISDGGTAYTAYAADLSAADKKSLEKLDKLKEVITYIKENYKESIDIDTLINGAYDGVFDKLDRWSTYYSTKEEEVQFTSTMEEGDSYTGIGVTITKDAGQTVVSSLNPAGSAFEEGMRAGDVIVSIDGAACANWELEAVSQKLRGKEGTTVVVGVERNGKLMSFVLTRRQLVAGDVSVDIIEGTNIGYIRISTFSSGVYWDFLDAFFSLVGEDITDIIIDLRGNIGGIMDEALNCAACLMIPGQELVSYQNDSGVIDRYTVIGDEQPFANNKYVVLVDDNTASASEAFVSAMKENHMATVVGTTTYGKGCAQIINKIDDETSYKLSVMYFYGPNDTKIDGVGVTPDYIVYNGASLTPDQRTELLSKIIPMNEKKKYIKLGS